MTALEVSDVTKRFGDLVAVDHVSFELGDRELLALVGPSGCGKSTLMRLVAGLHPVESGSITLGGTVVDDGRTSLPPERRRIGLVFQEHALFPHLTVAKNIEFGIRDDRRSAESQVRDMLDLVGLVEYSSRYPHELSGGERQRVALARALAPKPSLMLLDEPFASLDPNLRSRIRDDVVAILRSTDTPAVFVTHDQNEALAVGDRVAVMRAGRVAQLDTPASVFHSPADRFVAAFMGEADFLTADVATRAFPAIELTDGLSPDTTLMLRPDDVSFSVDPGGSATVTNAEFRGSTWCYTLELASGTRIRSIRSHLGVVAVGTSVAPFVRVGHVPVVIPN